MSTVFLKGQDEWLMDFFTLYYRSHEDTFSYKTLIDELDITYSALDHLLERVEMIQKSYPKFSMTTDGRKITVLFSESFLLNKIRVELTKNTLPYRVWDAIFRQTFHSMVAFSQSHYLSVRTVQRQLDPFDDMLARYHIKVNFKTMDYLLGEEYRIRFFFHNFYWHIYDEIDDNRPPIAKESINLFNEKVSEHCPFLRHSDTERFLNLLAVSVTRIKQGYTMREIPESVRKVFNPFMNRQRFESEILEPFFKLNGIFPKDLPQEEYLFLYYLFTIGQSYLIDTLRHIQLQSPMYLTDYRRLFEEWLDLLGAQLQVVFGHEERKFLLINTTYMFSFLLTFGPDKQQLATFGDQWTKEEMASEYQHLFSVIETIASSMKVTNCQWVEVLHSSSFKYYTSQFLYHLLMDHDISIRIALKTKGRGLEEQLQKQKLVRVCSRPIVLVEMDDQPDLVIADYAIDLKNYFTREIPYLLQWGEKQYEKDWIRVVEFIDKIREKKYQTIWDLQAMEGEKKGRYIPVGG